MWNWGIGIHMKDPFIIFLKFFLLWNLSVPICKLDMDIPSLIFSRAAVRHRGAKGKPGCIPDIPYITTLSIFSSVPR